MQVLKRIVASILTLEARLVLRRYKPSIIAITGSVGKTTTKDAIFAALSPDMHVRKSEKSFNSELGVPLTVLGLENAWRSPLGWAANLVRGLLVLLVYRQYPQWLVLEVGADRPGDIRRLAKWLRPDIAVLTGVPEVPVHIEFFRSLDQLVREKRALAEYLKPGGKLVLNGDDARMRALISDFRGACITYGFESFNEYRASFDEIRYDSGKPMGTSFRLEHEGSSLPVVITGSFGRPKVYALLAAIAVAQQVGIDPVRAAHALAEWVPPPGRMRIIEGTHGSIIVDDTYNSSPAAALAALETLRSIGHAKRKIAVLGDMLELGKFSAEAHRAVGEKAAECASMLFTIGLRAQGIAEAALASGMLATKVRTLRQDETSEAGEHLSKELKAGDVILVKGSQSMRMERIVRALMAHPEDAPRVLVRQETEWLTR
jgi:UDP-N-acetylmuramyl pentapeptide synthase